MGSQDFTVLDWVGTIMSAVGVIFLLSWPWTYGRAFSSMFADVGGPLPAITSIAIGGWIAPLVGIVAGALIVSGCFRKAASLNRRRVSIVIGFVVAFGGVAFCLWATYLPIMDLAGAVKA